MPWKCFSCMKSDTEDIIKLDYRHCSLSDVPPEVFAFERTLEELYLDANRIKDLPRPLFHCHGLRHLGLSDNEVQNIPAAISSLGNLEYLDISKNAISDIPDNIKGCKLLTIVDASVNPLEKLPEGFMQLLALEELYLNDAYLEYLPANFGRLLKLRILELRENHLNTLPKSIARLVNLQRLDIGQNEFSDLPEVVGQLPNITELWCDYNRIRSIPQFVGNLKKLVHLDASNNNINWIASEIENCVKLSDLTLSGNEVQEVPESIGNLKSLMTMKLDDNQLAVLPDAIGKLSNLEELILSQNDFETLPPSIGLLRKLHILNVDENMLEDLPPEIGSCCNLRILSVAGNRLIQIPGEIGHLSNLKVANLSGNRINNLPVSLLGLSSLAALWLSDNQAQPLVPLQSDLDPLTGQRVLTCFMLPQTSTVPSEVRSPPTSVVTSGYIAAADSDPEAEARSEEERIRRRHIRFAADSELDAGGRLLRAPTPYPKELRALARHARSLQRVSNSTNGPLITTSPLCQPSYTSHGQEGESATPVVAEWIPSGMQENKIKEAKVTKSQASPIVMTEVSDSGMKTSIPEPPAEDSIKIEEISGIKMVDESEMKLKDPDLEMELQGNEIRESIHTGKQITQQNGFNDKVDNCVPDVVDASKISSEHREHSLEISRTSGSCSVPLNDVTDDYEENAKFMPSSPSLPSQPPPSQPPPYHIAAAYSKKAAFFNSDVQSRSSISSLPPFSLPGGRLTPLSEMKDLDRPSSVASSKFDLPPSLGNHSVKERSWTSSPIPDKPDKNVNVSELREVNGNMENSLTELTKVEEEKEVRKMCIAQSERQSKMLLENQGFITDANNSNMNTYQNISSVTNIKATPPLESPDVHANISVGNVELNQSYCPEMVVTQSSQNLGDSYSNNSEPVHYDHVSSMKRSLLEDDDHHLTRNNSSTVLPPTSPEVSSAANSHLPEMDSSPKLVSYSVEKNHDNLDLMNESQKSVSSRIPVSRAKVTLRSTNEEMREISMGKPPNFTQDKPSAGTNLIAPTPQRVNTILTQNSGLEGNGESSPPSNNSYTTTNKTESISISSSRIPSVSGIPSPKTSPNWQQSGSSPYFTSKVPQPGFALSKRSNAISPSYGNSRQGTSPVLHNVESNIPKTSPSGQVVSKIPQLAGQTNSPSLSSGNGKITPKISDFDKSQRNMVVSSKIPTLSPNRSDVSPMPENTSKSRIPISPQSKPMKNWMFGLHKNAMVFPVNVHKNPGLGFSIAGGQHPNTSPDKQHVGIYITKIHPNGPASTTLQPGDKILEVDGIDFSKLEHDQAVSVLTQTGNVVQMMISRQQ